MGSTLIETININADDFTDNFLTCPTCMSAYDEHEHTPKLLPCSHTLCRCCLERIAASTALPVANSSMLANNSVSRTIAAADAAVAAINYASSSSSSSSSGGGGGDASPQLNANGSRLSQSSLVSVSTTNQRANGQHSCVDMCIRCPICRESIVLPRNGGIFNLPPSFIINQLIDLVKSKKSRDIIPRCLNHTNEELLFCETCDKSFCSLCESHFKVVSNADHIIIPFSIAIKRMAEIYLFKSNQCINSFNLALANVKNEIGQLNATVEAVVRKVDESFEQARRLADERKQQLLKQLTQLKETKTQILNDQIKLILNEKQKVEAECKQYHQLNIESKLLGAQIQNINEKLDCLRTLSEPRENSFIDYEYTFNDCLDQMERVLGHFGRFKTSNTYPPLCTARVTCDDSAPAKSTPSYSANLSVSLLIETVDYYGCKRSEGGDPVSVCITDPYNRQQYYRTPVDLADLNNGQYQFKFIPNLVGKYRLDVSVFSRPINQMPLYLNVVENIDPMWTFGGLANTSGTLSLFKNFNPAKQCGNNERDLNKPVSVRYANSSVYVLDSGNNRIKVLNKSGQFQSNLKHAGLCESSSTALAVKHGADLLSLNWRLKSMSDYSPATNSLRSVDLNIDEPICLMETFHPDLYLIQDNKRKLYLCTSRGQILFDSFELKIKQESGIKNITAFCGNLTERRMFIAGSSGSSASSNTIFEFNMDWLCDFKLNGALEGAGLDVGSTAPAYSPSSDFVYKTFAYPLNQTKTLSSSLTSLASTVSVNSTATTITTSSNCSMSGKLNGCFSALWHDKHTNKLLAAKAEKHKTVIEVYNGATCTFEYLIDANASVETNKPLKKVTSICSTDDGKLICVDLVQNFVKMFRFV